MTAADPTTMTEHPEDRFFRGKAGLDLDALFDACASDILLRTFGSLDGQVGDPWYFDQHLGVWRPAEPILRERLRWALMGRWRAEHAKQFLSFVALSCEPLRPVWADLRRRFVHFQNGLVDITMPNHLWRHDLTDDHWTEANRADDYSEWLTHPYLGDWTTQVPHAYEPPDWSGDSHLDAPVFEEFMRSSFPADALDFAWELVGYFLLSGNPLGRAFILKGGGSNGKSVFLDSLISLLGRENVASLSLQSLAKSESPSLWQLHGKTANVVDDLGATTIADTGALKSLVEERPILSNRKYRDPVLFVSTAKPIFACNTFPPSKDGTHGWERRFVVVPFTHTFPRNDRYQQQVAEAVNVTERSGIYYQAIQALARLMDRGDFLIPESFKEAQQEFRETNADGHAWAREFLEVDPEGDERGEELWRRYRDTWATGKRPDIKRPEFYNQLASLPGVTKYQDRKRATRFKGVHLIRIPVTELEEPIGQRQLPPRSTTGDVESA